MRLIDKVAVVTGAAKGIGRAIAIQFAVEGAHLAVADVDDEGLETLRAEVEQRGRRCLAVHVDVSHVAQIDHLVATALATYSRLDILVNSAGVTRQIAFGDVTETDWDRILDINLRGAFFTMQRVAPHLRAAGGGKIINISSIAGKGSPGASNIAYAASKGGMIAITKNAAYVLGPSNINVNAICPGATVSPMNDELSAQRSAVEGVSLDEIVRARTEKIPLRRVNTAEDVAQMAVFLASEESQNVSGQAINIDGGQMPI